ncbi:MULTISPECIES: ABC transporter substrate-binding protein [Arthrobacter]|uniref:ABC transporter substrate-binding protein n=1 Tax=Arthrobacter terricola TaxID=2547396 RepID=A0A4R5KHR6_9MICC|nr:MULTISPECIES: ABC transporter substrate-binding protein [Arthrobacter]MBT8161922.1 ABC transporter substrate-binding protein [Arthrobacter sp. GN70]TDF94298.1 ABC transporter substrate-binding protein [Arthrobacter terricola]
MKRLRLLTGGAAAALTLSLVACGGSTSQTAAVQSVDNVVVAVGALPDSLTPAPWGGSASHVVLSGLGSQLLEYKPGVGDGKSCPAPTTEVSGRLAESVKPSADGTGIVVTLRKLTSQYGNTLSAEDVRWSLDIGMKRQPVMKGTLKSSGFNIDNLVKVIDDHTVQLNTTQLTSYTVQSLQNNLFYIHDSVEAKKHVTPDDPTANAWLSKNLADYSGWKLEEFTPGASLTVTADPKWEGERGPVKRVVVKAVQSTATRSQLVESGEVQVANGFDYDQYKSLEKTPGVTVLNCPSQTRDTMMFNTKTGPLADPNVRHAISMAIDRNALVKGAYAGYGQPAASIFPGVDASPVYKFDQAGAKKLLADAGYPNGFPLTLSYSATRPGPVAAKSAVLIQSMLKEVGIDVQLQNVASSTDFSTALIEGRYQAVLYSEPIVIADPAFYSYAFYGTGAPSNTTGWSNPDFDKARAELAATPETQTDKRTALLNKMAGLVDDGAPILSLVETKGVLVAKTGLTGAVPLTNGQIYFNALGR